MSTVMSQYFKLAAIDPTRWKNGGGNTREIAVWPPGAGMDDFVWRLSVADIEADGPFSAFPGIDRQIVLLDGAGVMLRADDGSFSHRLVQPGAPFAFSGDTGLQAALLDGATRDFNVMTRRGRCRARVDAFRDGFTVSTGADTVCLLAVSGTWLAQDAQPAVTLDAGQGVLYPAGEPAGRQAFAPGAGDALCLCVTLEMEPDQ
ncbi:MULTISPECIES: HutD family protein [unclassified Cupriavidus]|uniref:HutD/Ves family protein n=2 Tax=unclassified Cupriavidus TaxID=2640874 RepID=UPI001AE572EF|nr:HutD family protein [Cupriavidus sp. AcVe19-1a]MBP0633881.1 HutD family protein [Cupriavidus sp. AcVe19-6a]